MANNDALNHAYNLFSADGYTGSIEDFNVLMSTDVKALEHAHSLFQKDGYKDNAVDFKNLVQGNIVHASVDDLKDYKWHTAEGDVVKTLNDIYNKQGFEIVEAAGMSDALIIKNTKTGEKSEELFIPSGLSEGFKGLLGGLGAKTQGVDLQEKNFQQLHTDITGFIEKSRNTEITEEGKLLKEQYEMSSHSMKGGELDIFSTDTDKEAHDVMRGDDGSLHTMVGTNKNRLDGEKTKLTTEEVVDLSTEITEQTRLLLSDFDNLDHEAGLQLEVLGGVREFAGRKFKELQPEERHRIGQAILTAINKKRRADGKGLISYTNFNKIFGDKQGNYGVLDTVIDKMKNDHDIQVIRAGLDSEDLDKDFLKEEMDRMFSSKTSGQQFKVTNMASVDGLKKEIKELNLSLDGASEEEVIQIQKQIKDKKGKIQTLYQEITSKAQEVGDNSLDDYFTRKEEKGVVYNDDRKKLMNTTFQEVKKTKEELIAEERARYANSITKREALQNLLEAGVLDKQNIIKESEEQFVTVNVDELESHIRRGSSGMDPRPFVDFIRKARQHGYVDQDGYASISVAKMYEFGLGGNQFDNWWDPMTGAFGHAKGDILSDENVEKLKHFKREMDVIDARNLALYDLGVLDQNPESVDDIYRNRGGSILQVVNTASKATLGMLGVDEADADKIISVGKEHTNRYMLDQYQQIAGYHNKIYQPEIEKGEVEVVEFTDEQVKAMTRTMGDNIAEGVGHFVPVLGQLAALSAGMNYVGAAAMTVPKIAAIVNGFAAMRKSKGAWSTYANVQYHFGKLALEEAKMRMAGFKPGSGAAFYAGGLAASGIRMGGRYTWLNPLFQKTFKQPIVGMGSMELAGITELGWEHLKGEVDFKREMVDLYGDFDEVGQRLITNAIVFGIMGGPKVKAVRSEGKWYNPKDWKVGTDFMTTEAKGRTLAKLRTKMDTMLMEKGAKTDKAGNITNRESIVKKLNPKELNKYNSYKHTLKDLSGFYLAESYNMDLNVKTAKGQEGFQKRIVQPLNEMLKSFNAEHGGLTVKFTENRSDFSQVEGKNGKLKDGGATAEYMQGSKGKPDVILIDPNKFTPGKMTHETTHLLLRSAFTNNNKYNNFVGKMRELFSEYNFVVDRDMEGNIQWKTATQLETAIKEKGAITGKKLDYRKPKEKDIGNEEFLAYMSEFLTTPEMYTQYAAPGFVREIKNEVQDFLQNTFGYNPKIQTPEDLMTTFAGFGRAIRYGEKRTIKAKSKQIANFFDNKMNFLGIEAKIAQEGGVKEMKRKSADIFKKEKQVVDAKEKRSELQEKLKQEQQKFLESKKELDPIKDKEKIAQMRDKFQEKQKVIREDIAQQDVIITGKRNYAKEILSFNEKTTDQTLRNQKIAELNEFVKQQMLEVRGIELVPKLHVERNKINRRINNAISENKKPSAKDLQKLKEIDQLVDWNRHRILSENLLTINSGRIEKVAKKAYEMGANYGEGRIGKSELKSALGLEFQKIINTYEFTNPRDFKAEFGAYMQPILMKRIGAAYKAETAGARPKDVEIVSLDKAQQVTDMSGPRQFVNESKGKVLTKEFNIDKETVDKIESKINNLTFEKLSYKTLKDLTPEITNELFGVTPKKGNLQRASVENAQDFIDLNAKTLIDLLPEGSVSMKNAPEFLKGTSTGVAPKLLEAFYVKSTERVATGPGGYPQTKAINSKNKADVVRFKEFFGINKDGTRSYDRNLSAKVKGIIAETGRAVTNQTITTALEAGRLPANIGVQLNIANLVNQVSTGKSKSLASKDLFMEATKALLDRKQRITVGSLSNFIEQKRWKKYEEVDRRRFYKNMKNLIEQVGVSDKAGLKIAREMEVRDAIMMAREYKNVSDLITKLNKGFGLEIKNKAMQGKKSYNDNSKDIARHNEMVGHIMNILPTKLSNALSNILTRTLYHGSIKRMGLRLFKTPQEIGGVKNQELINEGYFVENFGLERKGSGKKVDTKRYEAVYIAEPGKVKAEYTEWLKENSKTFKTEQELKENASEFLVERLRHPGFSFAETIQANKNLRKDYYKGLYDIINKAAKGKLLDSSGKKISLNEAVEGIVRHLQMQTNISTGIPKGTATILFSFFELGKPSIIKGKEVYFHSEHNMQLLNHTGMFLESALRNIGKKNQFTKEFETLDREFHQGLVLKELQKIYDGAKFGGPTTFSKEFKALKLGEISSIVNFMVQNGLSNRVLYLPGKKGSTVGDFIAETYWKKNQQLIDVNNKSIAKKLGVPVDPTNVLGSMKLFDSAMNEGRKGVTKRRGISVWDFDDTIATTKSGVLAKIPNLEGTPMPKRKAIFMAGGPGAGKSTVIKGLGLEAQGFKIVNQDISLQWLAKNHGLPKDMRDFTPEQRSKWSSLQWEAREIAQKKQMKFEGKGDGIIVDGTGQSAGSMTAQMNAFRRKGYDVAMLYVETSLPTALARNKARKERSLTDKIVERTWKSVDFNKKGFKEEFGENFIEVKTDKLKFGEALPKDVIAKADKFTKSYEKRRLTAEEFANRGKEILDKGGEFDFSEFELVREGKPGPFFDKFVKRMKKYGPEDNFILTARPPSSAPHIQMWLKMEGYEIPLKNIKALGNSTAEAKALWMLEKFSQGYNDMYFADDAIKNVKEVKNVLSQLDIKYKVQQAKLASKELFNKEFNDIIEQTTGFKSKYTVSGSKAELLGRKKGTKSIIVPGAQDFMGLMQNFMGKGKQGDAHRKWFEDKLVKPFAKGTNELNHIKQRIAEDFKALAKQVPTAKKNLTKKIPESVYTYEQAIRVHRWTEAGYTIPEISKRDIKLLNDVVNKDVNLLSFSKKLNEISQKNYAEPKEHWITETILSDLQKITTSTGRSKYLAEWIENKNIIFSKENLNKIEATQGKGFREALEDMLYRMETGSNRPRSNNKLANAHMDFINGSVGATMFFNMRSAVLQTISATNYINWKENNPIQAAKAFANQPQYWKDFSMIWNSAMLRQRRAGLKYNVQEAEIAAAVQGSTNKAKAAIAWLLKKGFTPTQIADSFAISAGGAGYYRNRVKMYKKKGLSSEAAKRKAWLDFQETTEKAQQSSRADLISQQQASTLGRTILAWANTPMQYMRIQEKAARDIVNRRGDFKSNMSKILYYGAIQSMIFAALQSALFSFGLDEEDEKDLGDKQKKDRLLRVVNTVADSQLRGIGTPGALLSAIKNTALEFEKQEKKGYRADHTRTILQLTSYSPVIGSKLRKLYSASQTYKYNKEVIPMMGPSLDNPANLAIANTVEATTNIPLARVVMKVDNLREAMDERNQWWQRIAMAFGWAKWDVGAESEELEEYKQKAKDIKKQKSKEKSDLKKQLKLDEEREELNKVIDKEKQLQKEGKLKDPKCSAIKSGGGRCGMSVAKAGDKCTIHEEVEKRFDGKEVRCKAIKKNGKRCKKSTPNKSGLCYHHD